MCGIVGLFIKDRALEPRLGALLAPMLVAMTDRGPDSAGFAIYSDSPAAKITIQSDTPEQSFDGLADALSRDLGEPVQLRPADTHAVVLLGTAKVAQARQWLAAQRPEIRIMGAGNRIEIYKEVGLPKDVARRFGLAGMAGSHAIGHTRMATESAVTTAGAHPFSTGPDQCLVHNGSLSNHNNLRRELIREGQSFATANDTEVAAGYISHRMHAGDSLEGALTASLRDLDGFFTFVVGTENGFGVLRDPIACKPAVMAETNQYVAFGTEYRALADLPGVEQARVWEPEPAKVYFWERN